MAHLTMPHIHMIQGSARVGMFVEVHGKVNSDNAFTINFQTDRTGTDMPFHISVRPSEDKICYNSKKNGGWQKEKDDKLKLKPGQDVTVAVVADKKDFDVYVNGDKYQSFSYREPIESIHMITVEGSLILESFTQSFKIDKIPFAESIGNWQSIKLAGIASKDFLVNINDAEGNTLMHVNPRFSQDKIVINSRKGEMWQTEQRPDFFPYKKNDVWDMQITDVGTGFKVVFNHDQHVTFEKRWQAHGIKLEVNGDNVDLYACEVQQGQQQVRDSPHMGGGGSASAHTYHMTPQMGGGGSQGYHVTQQMGGDGVTVTVMNPNVGYPQNPGFGGGRYGGYHGHSGPGYHHH